MNLDVELEKLTSPPMKASKVRRYEPVEIEELLEKGEITPIDKILRRHICGTESMPCSIGRGSYVY